MFSAKIRGGSGDSTFELELRLLEDRHAVELFALIDENRLYLREWMPWADATRTEDDTSAFIQSQLEMFASGNGITAGIWFGDRIAGVIGTQRIDWLNHRVEIGYWIAQPFQGRGLVTTACRAFVEHLLFDRDLNRVEIRAAVKNRRSNAIPLRLGFKLEGIAREAEYINGDYHDLNQWAMLRSEFKRSK